MNGEDRKDLKLVLSEIKHGNEERGKLIDKVDSISVCLMGDPEDHEDLGLQGAVVENTRFRKTVKYWMGAIGLTTLTVTIKTFWKSIFQS